MLSQWSGRRTACQVFCLLFFFFSSRRRHTRSDRDWSSDVCSSDLIRSGTYQVPRGGVPEGLTTWEITLPQLLSAQGYSTGIWGKWHLGSAEARLPTNRGFDEWYGIPRTYSEVFWPELNDTHSLWPSVGSKQGWDPHLVPAEPIYEARRGEKPRTVGELDLVRSSAGHGKGNHHASCRIHKEKRGHRETI